jgi:hypothetical protein
MLYILDSFGTVIVHDLEPAQRLHTFHHPHARYQFASLNRRKAGKVQHARNASETYHNFSKDVGDGVIIKLIDAMDWQGNNNYYILLKEL